MVYLSVASRSAPFTLAEIVLATYWQLGGNRWLRGNCHHIGLIVDDRQDVASTLPSIVKGCQTTETLGDLFKLFKKIAKSPSVAVVTSIVNELPVLTHSFLLGYLNFIQSFKLLKRLCFSHFKPC